MTISPRPTGPARHPAGPPPRPPRAKWGWLEWFIVLQLVILPAMYFIPGLGKIRVIVRLVTLLAPMLAWASVVQSGRARPSSIAFPAAGWLVGSSIVLLLEVFHPDTNSPLSGLAQAILYISVLCPAFWVPRLTDSTRLVPRIIAILIVCNGLSATLGLLQVFRPATFNPAFIPGYTGEEEGSIARRSTAFTDASGNEIVRPCGLSDSVGAAAYAGFGATLMGLAYALRPLGLLKRLICLAITFIGVAVIYYSQIRTTLVMLAISLIVLIAILSLQRDFKRAGLLGALGVALIVGAFSWVAARSGLVVVERFLILIDSNVGDVYTKKSGRAGFVEEALTVKLPEAPIGQGLGRWGTVYSTFGEQSKNASIWVEVMISAWVVDGGAPLLILYVGAIVAAMGSTLFIALRSKDRELAFWAAVVFAWNASITITCLSYVVFITTLGQQFWLLSAMIHGCYAASLKARSAGPASAARRPVTGFGGPGTNPAPPPRHDPRTVPGPAWPPSGPPGPSWIPPGTGR